MPTLEWDDDDGPAVAPTRTASRKQQKAIDEKESLSATNDESETLENGTRQDDGACPVLEGAQAAGGRRTAAWKHVELADLAPAPRSPTTPVSATRHEAPTSMADKTIKYSGDEDNGLKIVRDMRVRTRLVLAQRTRLVLLGTAALSGTAILGYIVAGPGATLANADGQDSLGLAIAASSHLLVVPPASPSPPSPPSPASPPTVPPDNPPSPAPPQWIQHERTNCYSGHGASSGGADASKEMRAAGVASVKECESACKALSTHACEAIVVTRVAAEVTFGCWLVRDVRLSDCVSSDSYDVFLHPLTTPFAPFPPAPPAPPPYPPGWQFKPSRVTCGLDGSVPTYPDLREPIERYRGWWECHLFENGPFSSLNDGPFRSEAELRASDWFDYLDGVYGSSTLRYPLSIGSLVYFHRALLPPGHFPARYDANGYRYGEFTAAHYPLADGDIWRAYRWRNTIADRYGANGGGPKQVVMSRGLPSYSLAEVTHRCCDWFEQGMSQGYWHYLQPGSGIFLNIGNTIITESEWLGPQGCGAASMPAAVQCLLHKGYDTWQRPHIFEAGAMLFEIVNLRDLTWHGPNGQAQWHGCFDPDAFDPKTNASRYFTGWDGSGLCTCKQDGAPMNCRG